MDDMEPERNSRDEEDEEEHEEGEISDEEPLPPVSPSPELESSKVREDGQGVEEPAVGLTVEIDQKKDVSLMHMNLSLDDLMRKGIPSSENRKRSDPYRNDSRDERDLDEDVGERKAWNDEKSSWRRESSSFANGGYGSNLYNFAWAQAVSGRPSFSPAGSPDEERTFGPASGFRDWPADNAAREFGRELEKYRRGRSKSSEEPEDLSPVDNGKGVSAGRLARMRSVEKKDTRIGFEERFISTGRIGRVEMEDDEDSREYGDDDRAASLGVCYEDRGKRSGSGSPNGRHDDFPERTKASPEAASTIGEKDDGDREEGELEEGEIEFPPEEIPSAKEIPQVDRQTSKFDGEDSAYRSAKEKYSSKLDPRSLSKHYSRSQNDEYPSRKSRQSKSEEYERERRLSSTANLVKNVTVKDAQKSFTDVCERLQKALRNLDELYVPRPAGQQEGRQEPPPRDVSSLARQAFAGIRAVYAVRNTASGREQERDKNIFPRLLELAYSYRQKLFTVKQGRELEVMMQAMATAGRYARDAAEKAQYPRDQHILSVNKKIKDDSKQRDPPVSFPTTKQQGITKTDETNVAGRLLSLVDAKQAEEAAAIAAAALAYARSSAAARSSPAFANSLSDRQGVSSSPGQGIWGWYPSDNTSQAHGNGVHTDTGYNSSASRYQQWNEGDNRPARTISDSSPLEGTLDGRTHRANKPVVSPLPESINQPPGYQRSSSTYSVVEEDWEALSPPGASTSGYVTSTVGLPPQPAVKNESAVGKAWSGSFPQYPKNVGVTRLYSSERLPSPTPDEENEDDHGVLRPSFKDATKVLPVPEASKAPPQHGLALERPQFPKSLPVLDLSLIRTQSLDSSAAPIVSSSDRGVLTDITMLPSPTRPLDTVVESVSTLPLQSKGVLIPAKSRDPRRRPQHPSVDYDAETGNLVNVREPIQEGAPVVSVEMSRKRTSPQVDSKDDGATQKRQKILADGDKPQDNGQERGQGTGGWLDDNMGTPVPSAEQGPVEMEVDEDFSSGRLQESARSVVSCTMSVSGDERPAGIHHDLSSSLNAVKKQKADVSQQVVDTNQRRMKPRDPRRLLLEHNASRGDLSLVGGDAEFAVDTSRAPEVIPTSVLPPVKSTADDQTTSAWNSRDSRAAAPQASTIPTTGTQVMDKLSNPVGKIGSGTSVTGATAQSHPVLQGTGPSVASVGETPEFSSSKVSGETQAISANSRVEVPGSGLQKGSDLQIQKTLNQDTGPRKPKASPGQWGASQVHPGLEKILEELSEKERLAVQQERERRMEEQDRMFSEGKLCLVLDLDHTLLNSAKFSEIEPEWEHRLRIAEAAERSRTNRDPLERRELYRFPHMSMWTKLRPGIWKFLARASQLFELHVYTMGNKVYATEMAKLLDPTGTLFAGRVISKGDDGDGDDIIPKSKDLDGVLGMESAVIIIDDSARVWPHHSHNLIVVERYMYFPCSRRQFGLAGPSLLEVGHDEREADGMIASVLGVIDRIHKSFFENQRLREVDVRDILAAEQRQVLAGCKVVFSRIFPVGEAQPHLHPLWRTAEQFGAVCTTKIDDDVTHVVAISPGTDKVNWALSTGRFVVRPAWIEASSILYRRANERDFSVPSQ
ncbi:hypothetical protein R1sor_027380 [Riccia sorocarpa]|uniref:protein-serine/threonine phosphatase n=1 Tax=Riccia sorocarpa TaxID=122646 RepID=A0ABD3GE05_9MARC